MDSNKIQLKGTFRVCSFLKKRRGVSETSLFWLLEEPTVFEARLDESNENVGVKCNVSFKKGSIV